jgi:hypothetical protein
METRQERLSRTLNNVLRNAHHVLRDPEDEAVYRSLLAAAESAARSNTSLVWPAPSTAEVRTVTPQ